MMYSRIVFIVSLFAVPSIGQDCCSTTQCDSDGMALLHRYGEIGSGPFDSLRVKLCSDDRVTIQLWNPEAQEDGVEWILEWQTTIQATSGTQIDGYTEFPLSQPFTMTTNHRLGIFSDTRKKVPVPCEFDSLGQNSVSRSAAEQFTGSYTLNERYSFETTTWPRDFSAYVKFCYDGSCMTGWSGNGVVSAGPQGPPGPQGAKGETGDQGPPGQVCTQPVDPEFPVAPQGCDNPESQFYNDMIEAQNAVEAAKEQLDELLSKLPTDGTTGGTPSGAVAGRCLPNYTYGSYGIGKCYIFANSTPEFPQGFNWAQFISYCAEREGSPLPARPMSELENKFLASNIYLPPGKTEITYWIGGIYSDRTNQWLWYEPDSSMINPIPGDPNTPPDDRPSFWEEGQPIKTNENLGNYCVGFKKYVNNFFRWVTAPCTTMQGIICEREKVCN